MTIIYTIMGHNSKNACIVLESLGQTNPQIWVVRGKDGNWSLPKSNLEQLKESVGFDISPIPTSQFTILSEDGKKISYSFFVRTGIIAENSSPGRKLVSFADAWALTRGSLNFSDSLVIEESSDFLKSLGMKPGLDDVMPLSEGKTLLVEREMTTMSKVLLFAIGAWLVGKFIKLKMRGNQQQISTLAAALLSSKKFQEELRKPGASMDSVIQRLKVKNMDADRFEKTFGIKWPV